MTTYPGLVSSNGIQEKKRMKKGYRKYPNRKDEIFEFIIKFKIGNDGKSPTLRDIIKNTVATSTSVVSDVLDELEEDGKIERGELHERGIRVFGGKWVYKPEIIEEEIVKLTIMKNL